MPKKSERKKNQKENDKQTKKEKKNPIQKEIEKQQKKFKDLPKFRKPEKAQLEYEEGRCYYCDNKREATEEEAGWAVTTLLTKLKVKKTCYDDPKDTLYKVSNCEGDHSLLLIIKRREKIPKWNFILQTLLHSYGKKLIHETNRNLVTPLLQACADSNFTIVKFLLQHGAGEVKSKNPSWNELTISARNQKIDIIYELIQNGFSVNDTRSGWSALMYAIKEKRPDITDMLLDHKADIHYMGKEKWNALHFASGMCQVVTFDKLLKARSKLDHLNDNKQTALQIAGASGHWKIITLIVEVNWGYIINTEIGGEDKLKTIKSIKTLISMTQNIIYNDEKQNKKKHAQITTKPLPDYLNDLYKCLELLEESEYYLRRPREKIYLLLIAGHSDPECILSVLPREILKQIAEEALLFLLPHDKKIRYDMEKYPIHRSIIPKDDLKDGLDFMNIEE